MPAGRFSEMRGGHHVERRLHQVLILQFVLDALYGAVLVIDDVGAAVGVGIEAVDPALDVQIVDFLPVGEREIERDFGLRLEGGARPRVLRGEAREVVEHGVAQALGVVAVGDVQVGEVLGEDALEKGGDVLGLAATIRPAPRARCCPVRGRRGAARGAAGAVLRRMRRLARNTGTGTAGKLRARWARGWRCGGAGDSRSAGAAMAAAARAVWGARGAGRAATESSAGWKRSSR